MTEKNIFFVLELCVLGWAILTVVRNKKLDQLYSIIGVIGVLLGWYPFYLPLEVGLTIWSALGVWIAFREVRYESRQFPLRILRLMLIMFTFVFLMKALIEMKIL